MGSVLLIVPVLAPEPMCAAVCRCFKCSEEEVAVRDAAPGESSQSSRDGCFPRPFQGSETFSPGRHRLPAGRGSLAQPRLLCRGITRTASLCLGPVRPRGGGGGWSCPTAACTVPLQHPMTVALFLPKSLLGHLERLLLRSLEVTASRKGPWDAAALGVPAWSQPSWWH